MKTEGMLGSRLRAFLVTATLVGAAGGLLGARHLVQAGTVPRTLRRSFAYPVSLAAGVTGDLVAPAGSTSTLTLERGLVAIGYLPVPRPERIGRPGRGLGAREFVRPADATPHARLLLSGVLDAAGNPVSNTGNEFVIDAVVSPSSAASSPPPFVIPFDIHNGMAFIDAPLPLQGQPGAAVRVQVLGAAVIDPEGQPFGVLGFAMAPLGPTPPQRSTPTPGETPATEGQCFVGAHCSGPSFSASQERCCHLSQPRPGHPFTPQVSWCPPDQFDVSTGQCTAEACGSAVCSAPTPCSVGQCFDTIGFRCTGQACGPGLRCPLANEFCDVSGRRCPCSPPSPPPPPGRVCCQCKDPAPACFTLSLVEVQPICPPGCETVPEQECDPQTNTCVAATSCSADPDCDDGNGCTIDHCRAGTCTHDCVCVGPLGCGPGPGRH